MYTCGNAREDIEEYCALLQAFGPEQIPDNHEILVRVREHIGEEGSLDSSPDVKCLECWRYFTRLKSAIPGV